MNNAKTKIPLIVKGKIVPASVIESKSQRASIFCQQFTKCFENRILQIENACIFNKKKAKNIESIIHNATEMNLINRNSKKKQKKTSRVKLLNKNKIVDKMEFFDEDYYDCPICFHIAIDRDINNAMKSCRTSCLVNKSHYFYKDDIYFENHPNEHSNQIKKELDRSKLKFTFALIFGGDNSIFNKKCSSSTIYSRFAVKESTDQLLNSNTNTNTFEINNLNFIVTRV